MKNNIESIKIKQGFGSYGKPSLEAILKEPKEKRVIIDNEEAIRILTEVLNEGYEEVITTRQKISRIIAK